MGNRAKRGGKSVFWLEAGLGAAAGEAPQAVFGALGNWWPAATVVLLAITVLVLFLLGKWVIRLLVNAVLGVVAWAVTIYVFKVQIGYWLSLAAAVVFGPLGIGVLLFLKFFGVSV